MYLSVSKRNLCFLSMSQLVNWVVLFQRTSFRMAKYSGDLRFQLINSEHQSCATIQRCKIWEMQYLYRLGEFPLFRSSQKTDAYIESLLQTAHSIAPQYLWL
jgi:hypothetical protein